MSRYNIPTKNEKYSCVVGYDNPLQTYFAQVYDEDAVSYNETVKDEEVEREEIVMANGFTSSYITDVEILQDSVRAYADIPKNVKQQLVADKANSKGPNSFQKSMINLVESLMNQYKG